MQLPIVGKVACRRRRKEALLAFWQGVEQATGLKINYGERVESYARERDGFVVQTTRAATAPAPSCWPSAGAARRASSRSPGEELPKVVYRLIDPEQYRRQHVLVVGGGDSALEAAVALAEQPGTTVTLSYRGAGLRARPRRQNRERVRDAAEQRTPRGVARVAGRRVSAPTEVDHRARRASPHADRTMR